MSSTDKVLPQPFKPQLETERSLWLSGGRCRNRGTCTTGIQDSLCAANSKTSSMSSSRGYRDQGGQDEILADFSVGGPRRRQPALACLVFAFSHQNCAEAALCRLGSTRPQQYRQSQQTPGQYQLEENVKQY